MVTRGCQFLLHDGSEISILNAKLYFCKECGYYGPPKCAPVFAVRFFALSKVIFDYLKNRQFKYTVFDYLLNSQSKFIVLSIK